MKGATAFRPPSAPCPFAKTTSMLAVVMSVNICLMSLCMYVVVSVCMHVVINIHFVKANLCFQILR